MTRLLILVISIGLADSLNPATVAPALYLSTTNRPQRQVAEFAAGALIVNLLGGVLIALGPGKLLLAIVPSPSATAKHVVQVAAGAALACLAGLAFLKRDSLRRRRLTARTSRSGSGFVLGAGIIAVELPTALPYFAAIAAIVAADAGAVQQLMLLVSFNVAFLAPVLAILCVLLAAGDRAERVLAPATAWLEREWPLLVAGLCLLAGAGLLGFGLHGLAEG